MASMTTTGLAKCPSINLPRNSLRPIKPSMLCTSGLKRLKLGERTELKRVIRASSSNGSSSSASSSPGLYSATQLELTVKNVDLVLEDVRPYLISDGGNVSVVSVQDGVISLELQGACESCPSSTTTMTMGIERVLREKFGDAIKDIQQINGVQINETSVEAVNSHLDILRPAIQNYGGKVDVIAIGGGDCIVKYEGPETIGSGIKAAIKEKFPDIVNVVFTS